MATGRMQWAVSGGNAGFSMIDVLVAIIVLTVGLLALGVLQAALTRNAADSLARSQVAVFTEGLIEQARSGSYDCVGSNGAPPCTGAGPWTTTPNSTGTPVQQAAYAAQVAARVSNLKVTQTVTTYYANAAGSFSTTAPATVSDTTPQYKRLDAVSTWIDASGTNRTLTLNTIISPVTIKYDPTVFNQNVGTSRSAQVPIVRQDNPVGPGVIPIATGSGNNTAATNPKPEISGAGNKTSPIAGTTSFNVLTYHTATNNEAEIQRRVETLVVSCSCQFNTNLPTGVFAQPYRPTYWNGSQYVSPQATVSTQFPRSNAAAPPNSGPDPGITVAQSPYCTECCRDHHDTAAATVKFDTFRTLPGAAGQPYAKYKYDTSTPPVLVPASPTANDKYVNACRLIRVDGIFHTATDLQSSHMGLLATQGSPPATSPLPDPTYTGYYQNFVVDYLSSSYVSATPPAVSTVNADQKYASYGLNAPASIALTSATTDVRYLHVRGLYVDYLEAPAITAIQRACSGNNLTSACVLPMLPFTTINTTELATWKSSDVSPYSTLQVFSAPTCVDPSGLTAGTSVFPIRGCVAAGSTPAPSKTANAIVTMTKSNSGVAIAQPIDPDDAVARTNQQQFTVPGTNTGGSVTVSLTGLTLANYTISTYPLVAWKIGTVQLGCINSSSATPANPNPYTCQPATLPGGVTVVIGTPPVGSAGGYNTTVVDSKTSKDPCNSRKKTYIQYCPTYKVDTTNILVNGARVTPAVTVIGTSGALSEGSAIAFPNLNPSDKVSVAFTLVNNNQATYTCIPDPAPATTSTVSWNPCTP